MEIIYRRGLSHRHVPMQQPILPGTSPAHTSLSLKDGFQSLIQSMIAYSILMIKVRSGHLVPAHEIVLAKQWPISSFV
ncbi:hypothetical protein PVAG01_10445 [Phlyctema vagabunda]|uniref:Uncharacterized protein n=1 Tax=Phlyctema vagabunda TaxID=108571 RepID=A0ABR4P5Z1_9HELO